MEITLTDCIIEITRKCNLSCEHCLRGDAENVDIDLSYIDRLFQSTNYISCLTITGGEPALNIEAIRYIYDCIIRYDVKIGNFFLVTNGLLNQTELLIEVIKLYEICRDNEITSVAISHGFFHGYDLDEIKSPLKYLKFFEDTKNDPDYDFVIPEGRGEDCSYMEKDEIDYPLTYTCYDSDVIDDDSEITIDNMFYLNAKGDIVTNCDWSYQTQEKQKLANITEKNWIKKLIEKGERID